MPPTPPAAQVGPAAARAIEAEVRGNVLAQPFGAGTVADLALPGELVSRIADRAIIASFNDRYRVVEDRSTRPPSEAPEESTPGPGLVRLVRGVTAGRDHDPGTGPSERRDVPRNLGGARPGAFEARLPTPDSPYELRRATELVTRRLAREGLLATAMEALRAHGPAARADPAGALGRSGIPTDLLAMFELQGAGGFSRGGAAEWMVSRLASGAAPGAIREDLRRAAFVPEPTLPGFTATDDSGTHTPLAVRLQLTRDDDWLGPGDGGSLDVARQLVAMLPEVPLIISSHESHADRIAARCAAWARSAGRGAPITVIAEGWRLSQWAQDNARPGTVERADAPAPAALLPRYASRADECSAFVPGDTFAAESLACAGIEVARSPLHFQGGNMLCVCDGRRRVLLLGEAEIARNIALGLNRDQTIRLFCAELGADEAAVLPGASYHLDYELFVRAGPNSAPVACVADEAAGAEAVIDAGLDALVRSGALSPVGTDASRPRAAMEALARGFDPARGFISELASLFSTGAPGDPGAAALSVLLEAVDGALARERIDAAAEHRMDRHALAMLEARRRAAKDREQLRCLIADMGWRVVRVPSLPAPRHGLASLNAINAQHRALVPAGPDFFAAADARTHAALAECGIETAPVRTAESQRRHGALRCSAAVFG